MPFNIELRRFYPDSNASIKIQASKNTITIYCNGPESQTDKPLAAWAHLEEHFITDLPGYHEDWVRGPDAPHIKRNHTNKAEVPIAHFHREFESEVTPELFALYLNNIYTQQQEHYEESVKDYSFFENEGEVEEIIEKFTIYYKEYEKSDVEKLFNDETKLTPEEKIAYKKAVSDHNEEKHLKEAMTQIFIQQIFFKPLIKERSTLIRYNLEPTEESGSRPECVLM